MDKLTETFKEYHTKVFSEHGATPKGVDWNDPKELDFRYKKMMEVLNHDFDRPNSTPTILDVGCGWGGLLEYCDRHNIDIDYTGIDVVDDMIHHGEKEFKDGKFLVGDVFEYDFGQKYDYVICNAIMTQRLEFTIPQMEAFCDRLVLRMYELCKYGTVFNFMSTRVNFVVNNLYYRNPMEALDFCLRKVSPRVKLDHSYSSLERGKDKYFDFTMYVYRD